MPTMIATFVDGVFKPASPLNLPPNTEAFITFDDPAKPSLTVEGFNNFLQNLPSLGDDAVNFTQDVQAMRAEFPVEASPWD